MWDLDEETAIELVGLFRWQRHDFLNHLQVIMGYTQLKKSEQALEQARLAIADSEKKGAVLRLAYPLLSLWLFLQATKAYRAGTKVEFNILDNLDGLELGDEELSNLVALAWGQAMFRFKEGFTMEVSKAGKNRLLAFRGEGKPGEDEVFPKAVRSKGAEIIEEGNNGFVLLLPSRESQA